VATVTVSSAIVGLTILVSFIVGAFVLRRIFTKPRPPK